MHSMAICIQYILKVLNVRNYYTWLFKAIVLTLIKLKDVWYVPSNYNYEVHDVPSISKVASAVQNKSQSKDF